jgi:hypothetical protein
MLIKTIDQLDLNLILAIRPRTKRPAVIQLMPRVPVVLDSELLSPVVLSAVATGGVVTGVVAGGSVTVGGSGVIANGVTVIIKLSLVLPPSPLQLML